MSAASTANGTNTAATTTAANRPDPLAANDGFAIARIDGSVAYTPVTRQLLESIGGVDGIIRVTTRFYAKFHEDRHLRQFLGGLQQPLTTHAARLGMYIAEMMGAPGAPWTGDCRTRERTPIRLANGRSAVVTDRFAAHHCAWHSVDRPAEKVGRRFKLDDCRVWMRLMFWAARECGHDESSPFFRYFVKFIAHFIAIYETTARPFARAEARWSADPANTERYLSADCYMDDVVDVPLRVAQQTLPRAEHDIDGWLYDAAPIV